MSGSPDLRNLAPADRPREKLAAKGPQALSDQELIAVLLGSGTRDVGVLGLAARVLAALSDAREKPDLAALTAVPGVGPVKAGIIAAALEFARRRIRPEGFRIAFPADVLPLVRHYADRKQEHFLCVSLTGANEVIATRVVTVGLADRSQVHPREVFADPLTDRAAAVILAHNHPAGGVEPSREDISLTGRLREAGAILGIPVRDHIIFNRTDHYSFLDHDE